MQMKTAIIFARLGGRFFNLTLLIVKLDHTLEVVKVEIQIWRSKRTSKETGWGLFLVVK